jgi:hypothetical protein
MFGYFLDNAFTACTFLWESSIKNTSFTPSFILFSIQSAFFCGLASANATTYISFNPISDRYFLIGLYAALAVNITISEPPTLAMF